MSDEAFSQLRRDTYKQIYGPHAQAFQQEAEAGKIQAAKNLLEKAGYTVTPPQ